MTQSSHKNCLKEAEIATLQAKQVSIEKKIDEIHRVLLGNGKEGLQDMMNRYDGGLKTLKALVALSLSLAGIALTVIATML